VTSTLENVRLGVSRITREILRRTRKTAIGSLSLEDLHVASKSLGTGGSRVESIAELLLKRRQATLTRRKTRAEIEELGQAHGVPLAGLLSLADCLAADHIRERGVFVQAELPGGKHAPFPDGVIVLGGQRMGPLQDQPRTAPVWPAPKAAAKPALPLAGLKVLDLGVIVVGAETARLLGDLGAEVIKIESQAFPDGSRQTYLKIGLSAGFAAGHRNKRSLGLNLKSDEGKALFRRLVEQADQLSATQSQGERFQLYRDAEQIAVGEVGWLPLYSPQVTLLIRPSVKGLVPTSTPQGILATDWTRVRIAAE
jgi:crotonobetainyl-CoA:carnitine CoA-transferase CaiB-like acyl-CoA transferase